jgi:hypothetical protein
MILFVLTALVSQTDGKVIRLLPAWPREWDVDFKFHASHQTTVEGRIENGELVELNVAPSSRKKDVVIMRIHP